MDGSNTEMGITPGGTSEKVFLIVSAKDTDSSGTSEWKRYIDRDRLNEVWSAPVGSPFRQFEKTKTIDAVNKFAKDLKPRYSEGEITSEEGIGNLIKTGVLGKETAVVLDSGGAHSVAMAVKLARDLGYQPIVMFDTEPHQNGVNHAEQGLATLLYFSEEVKKLRTEGKIKADAPPAFIMDAHRNDFVFPGSKKFDNTYTYKETDLPNAQTLRQHGITKIVYLSEGDQHGEITSSFQSIDRVWRDLKSTVKAWDQGGIKMLYTGVKPWQNRDMRVSSVSDLNFSRFKE
jgi:hypothetical protein